MIDRRRGKKKKELKALPSPEAAAIETTKKYCKHELAIIYITYSTMIHDTAALFYISIAL